MMVEFAILVTTPVTKSRTIMTLEGNRKLVEAIIAKIEEIPGVELE